MFSNHRLGYTLSVVGIYILCCGGVLLIAEVVSCFKHIGSAVRRLCKSWIWIGKL